MKNTLLGWLAARGIILANDATDQTILQAVQKAFTDASAPVAALANEKETQGAQITTLENEKTALTTQVTALTNERDTARTTLANEQTARKAERSARAGAVVDLAITRGKLKAAERQAKIDILANAADEAAFKTAADGLLTGANIVKTIGGTNVEDRKVLANDMDQSGVRKTYLDAFSKHMTEHPDCDPVAAHQAVMSTHPALAEAMKKPSAP